jgi:hypothetical protein
VTTLLADHNIEGQARLLVATLVSSGWADLLELRLATFAEVGLAEDSSDRVAWRYAQDQGMFLLTDNRNTDGPDLLEQTLIEERTATILPVFTVSSAERLRTERAYRHACADRVAEVLAEQERYVGIPRIYIP